jgi:CheY-like chemotaxis protein
VRQRILVVDDETAIGKAVRRTLFGYDVTVLTSAREALSLVKSGERFDALVSDVNMPEMDGRELAVEIAKIAPALGERVLFLTGDSNVLSDLADRPKLGKPFDTHILRSRLEELLRPMRKKPSPDPRTLPMSERPTLPAPAGADDED